MSEELNGPAFPSNYVRVDTGAQVVNVGMSLRDYFAGQAINTLHGTPDERAQSAYLIADRMLAERAK
jgi:hypothetical protein